MGDQTPGEGRGKGGGREGGRERRDLVLFFQANNLNVA